MKMSRQLTVGLILGCALLGACSTDKVISFETRTMTIVSGNGQTGPAGGTLPNALTIALTVPDGTGAADVLVAWTVTSGGGSLSETSVLTDAQGRASVVWTLGGTPGIQSVSAKVPGSEGSPVTFTATAGSPPTVPPAPAPIVLHFDGTSWTPALADSNGRSLSLSSIWGASPSLVFAGGKSCSGSLMLRYDGTSWGQLPSACENPGNLQNFESVWGTSASDVYALENVLLPPWFNSNIFHYDGAKWTKVYTHSCGGCYNPLLAIWNSSPADVFAVGFGGVILHYDGSAWTAQAGGTKEHLRSVWGAGSAGPVFAVGDARTILIYENGAWRTQTSGGTQALNGVWGTSANNVFAVGDGGTILHYDGTTWTAQPSGTTQRLTGVWGTGNTVFAVGDFGVVARYDGTSWTAQTTLSSIDLHKVWGSSPTDVFAVGTRRSN